MVEGELSQLPVQFGREPEQHPFRRTRGGSAPSGGCACQRGPHHALRWQGWISGPGDASTCRRTIERIKPSGCSVRFRQRCGSAQNPVPHCGRARRVFESRSSTPSNSTRSWPGWRSTSGGRVAIW